MQTVIHHRKTAHLGGTSEFGASDRIRTGDLLRDREA